MDSAIGLREILCYHRSTLVSIVTLALARNVAV